MPSPALRLTPPRFDAPLPRPMVCIVDGAPGSLTALAGTLDAGGCSVQGAASSQEVFAQLECFRPDLILLEVALLGDLDGYEVCHRLKADERWRSIPVLFLGIQADAAARVRAFEAGAADFLSRPMHAAELLARVQAHARTGSLLRTLENKNAALQAEVASRREHDAHLQRSLDRAVVGGMGTRVNFCTEPARRLLERFFPEHRTAGTLPPAIAEWLLNGPEMPCRVERHGARLEARLHGRPPGPLTPRRYLLTLAESCLPSPHHGAARLLTLGLTPRESEVLYWIAHGKTNPETGIILQAAPNTIKKHMQNIMLKLGVETRLAAASRALELIGQA